VTPRRRVRGDVAPASDRGAAEALGLVVIAPAVIGLALLVVMLGRSVESEAQLRTAAEAAAQAAALERTHDAAHAAAERLVDDMLRNDTTCERDRRRVDVPNEPGRGVGMSAGLIEVTVTCTMSNRGVEVITDDRTESVTAYATVDQFRAGG
jgi:Flp pilus assembly protein TadG